MKSIPIPMYVTLLSLPPIFDKFDYLTVYLFLIIINLSYRVRESYNPLPVSEEQITISRCWKDFIFAHSIFDKYKCVTQSDCKLNKISTEKK